MAGLRLAIKAYISLNQLMLNNMDGGTFTTSYCIQAAVGVEYPNGDCI